MDPVAAAAARLRRALDGLESAVAVQGVRAGPSEPDAAALRADYETLLAENEKLRAARERDAALRAEAIERVDVAIATLREALGETPEMSAPDASTSG